MQEHTIGGPDIGGPDKEIAVDQGDAVELAHPGASPGLMQRVWSDGGWREIVRPLIREMPLTIVLNEARPGQTEPSQTEIVTLLCTPVKLNCLAIGFLTLEGIAHGIDDIALLRVCNDETTVEVRLAHSPVELPARKTVTSGCAGGVAFAAETADLKPVEATTRVSVAQVLDLQKQLQEAAKLYRATGGVHTSALAESGGLLVVAEDVGRHNTIDKIYGECLLMDVASEGRMLLTTGRISSEMVIKAVKMRVPIVVTRTAATDAAVRLATDLNVTLIGYARGSRLTVYTHHWRVSDLA